MRARSLFTPGLKAIEVTFIRPVLVELSGGILTGTGLNEVWRREIGGRKRGQICKDFSCKGKRNRAIARGKSVGKRRLICGLG